MADDLNADGAWDLAVTAQDDDVIGVLFGTGDGTFEPGFTLANDLSAFSVAIADLDGDGTNEIATANWRSDDVKVCARRSAG